MRRARLLSDYAWIAALLQQAALVAGTALLLPGGLVLGLILALPLPWMLRRSSYAHAANSLLIVVVLGGLMVFLDHGAARALAVLAALCFVASTMFVKWSAVERRAGLGARRESSDGASPAATRDRAGPGR